MDTLYGASDGSGGVVPNWRERQVCEGCGFNSRLRAAADILLTVLAPEPDARIYAQEQVTPFFRWLNGRFQESIGSEYLDPDLTGGTLRDGLRHEDATALSFPDASIDHVVSFEVLEHVPDYKAALREMVRVLRLGGCLLLSAPFRVDLAQTLVRASVRPDGTIDHHEAPEYHGNPIDPEGGSLCFYHFGWDLLDTMRYAGASEAVLLEYAAPGRGCHGPPPVFLLARR